ncbi:Wadjet anti-phage system protein JetD domain-containing protein [Rhodovibrio salinarum]|uniref:Wadjet protein JetD C-terminal domain-containing protein n=1 Tax=Rhodovibrio salinarum TaxID=1087 RepID=A0A934QKC2_9PROT|nr:Wadjet anti-phage system protein JetD domain-containing protein [Rhodovibrio salinarum]MBK1698297.1 hypothetical protein [Rhodovibrio salinarum]
MSAKAARETLNKLVDLAERKAPEARTRAIQQRLPERFESADAREAFESLMRQAHDLGAVTVTRRKGEAAHLLDRVYLRDLDRLYALLQRRPASELAAAAAAEIERLATDLAHAGTVAGEMAAAWRAGRQYVGFARTDTADAAAFLRALDTVLHGDFGGRDMRTVAARRLGDSKAIERHRGAIARVLRAQGSVDLAADDLEALAAVGLEKFPPEVRLAGPVRVGSADLAGLTFAAIPPEHTRDVDVPAGTRLVTIENLASFNRYVREARPESEAVVYTGGFPSRAVAGLLRHLAGRIDACHHWGDIDATGLRIAVDVGRHLGCLPALWCMDASTARAQGQPVDPAPANRLPHTGDPVYDALAAFLGGPEAHTLEQEELDPVSPAANAAA